MPEWQKTNDHLLSKCVVDRAIFAYLAQAIGWQRSVLVPSNVHWKMTGELAGSKDWEERVCSVVRGPQCSKQLSTGFTLMVLYGRQPAHSSCCE